MAFPRVVNEADFAKHFPSLVLGVEQLDRDHAHLLELLGDIEELNKHRNPDSNEVLAILTELTKYASEHFAREDQLMTAIGYEHIKEHRAEHAQLTKDVSIYVDRFESGTIDVADVTNFMQRWLIHHIAGTDTLLAQSLKKAAAS
jgi:hemerythrin